MRTPPFTPCLDDNLLNADEVITSAGDTEILLIEAAEHNRVTRSRGYKRCKCQVGCTTGQCTCKAFTCLCNSKHGTLPCKNK